VEDSCILVANVRGVSGVGMTCITIGIFTRTSTSAQVVADVVEAAMTWQYTREFIQDRNHLNVIIAAKDLCGLNILLNTAELTVARNHTSVACVTRRLVSLAV